MKITLHLVLTHHWYDEIESGRKIIEYRAITPHWTRLIWDRRERIDKIRFSRGYSKTTTTRVVDKIDLGPCPIPGWSGDYYRTHFKMTVSDRRQFTDNLEALFS